MKKILFAGLLICLCIAVAACTATDPDNLFETKPDNSGTSTPENHEDATASLPEDTQPNTEDIVFYTGAYQYGNMQKNLPAGDFMLLGNKVLFNYIIEGKPFLYAYDLVSESVKLYCNDATCDHDDCVASNLWGNLEVYNGKLYGQMMMNETGDTIYPAVADGNAAEVIVAANIDTFFHHENKLYIKTVDSSLVVLEEGQKEPQVIMEEYTGHWHTIFGNYLYANKPNKEIIRVDLTVEDPKEEILIKNAWGMIDGEHIYYIDMETKFLYRCALDGTDSQLIDKEKVAFASMNFDDEYFYYKRYTEPETPEHENSYNIYRFSKKDPTQIDKIATLPIRVYQIFTVPGTGKIFVQTVSAEGQDEPLTYIMGTDGSNPTKLEIPKY